MNAAHLLEEYFGYSMFKNRPDEAQTLLNHWLFQYGIVLTMELCEKFDWIADLDEVRFWITQD